MKRRPGIEQRLAELRKSDDTFIDQYFAARETVNRLKRELGKEIRVDLLLKNNDGTHRLYQASVDQIDNHIPEKYSRADVQQMLAIGGPS